MEASQDGGFAAYACSPQPIVSSSAVSNVEITSSDTLLFANTTFVPGDLLEGVFAPKWESWEEFYKFSIVQIVEVGLHVIIIQPPDIQQRLVVDFKISFEDGRVFALQSDPFVVK